MVRPGTGPCAGLTEMANSYKVIQNKDVAAGFLLVLWYAVTGLNTIVQAPSNAELKVLTMAIIPFILGLWLTKNHVDALLLVWMSETFFGGNGHWVEIGPVSGRWLLLLLLLLFGMMQNAMEGRSGGKQPLFTKSIIFYGAWFPLWLVLYSAGIQGNRFWKVIGDVNYLYALLIYFPVRSLIFRRYSLFLGWLYGTILVIAILSLYLVFAPPEIGQPLFWAVAGENVIGTTSFGISRTTFLGQIILFVGCFIGLFSLGDATRTTKPRVMGFLLLLLSIAPLSLLFLRGPLIGLGLVIALFVLVSIYTRKMVIAKWFIVIGAVFFVSTATLYNKIIPEALDKFAFAKDDYEAYLSESRVEQSGLMLKLFAEKPLLGQGVGTPVIYSNGQERYDFELQYNMLLYRVGVINMIVLLIPLAWFFKDLVAVWRTQGGHIHQIPVKITLSVLLSLLVIFIAGAMNPYLLVVYTPLLIAIYLSHRELLWDSRGGT